MPHPEMDENDNLHVVLIVEDVDVLELLQRLDEVDEVSSEIVEFGGVVGSGGLLVIFAVVINHQSHQQL